MLIILLNLTGIVTLLLLLPGCGGLTLGPTIERKAIIVNAGVPIEVLENVEVEARVLGPDGPSETFTQDIGGWITMHPSHYKTVKEEMERLRKKAGEAE